MYHNAFLIVPSIRSLLQKTTPEHWIFKRFAYCLLLYDITFNFVHYFSCLTVTDSTGYFTAIIISFFVIHHPHSWSVSWISPLHEVLRWSTSSLLVFFPSAVSHAKDSSEYSLFGWIYLGRKTARRGWRWTLEIRNPIKLFESSTLPYLSR
jgi:hypothetical protein